MKPDPPKTVATLRVAMKLISEIRPPDKPPIISPQDAQCRKAAIAGNQWLTQRHPRVTSRALPTPRAPAAPILCPGGGIGRRAGFRYLWQKCRGSSSLLLGTRDQAFSAGLQGGWSES